jgi:hypothetical protein
MPSLRSTFVPGLPGLHAKTSNAAATNVVSFRIESAFGGVTKPDMVGWPEAE